MWNQVQPELSMKFETFQNYDPTQSVLISEWNSIAEVLRNGELHEREFVLRKKASTEVSPLVQSRRACNLLFCVVAVDQFRSRPDLLLLLGRWLHLTIRFLAFILTLQCTLTIFISFKMRLKMIALKHKQTGGWTQPPREGGARRGAKGDRRHDKERSPVTL